MITDGLTRRAWITSCVGAAGICLAEPSSNLFAESIESAIAQDPSASAAITSELVKNAAWVSQLRITDEQAGKIASALNEKQESITRLRGNSIDDSTPMATAFLPSFFTGDPNQKPCEKSLVKVTWLADQPVLSKWSNIEEVAFWTVKQLGAGLRQKLFTSEQLTQMYLERLRKFNPTLNCVVSFNPDAINQARVADELFQKGIDKGPLHGIPWGAKDIISIPNMPTTWGASAYRETTRGGIATVAQKMSDAQAVLLGKLSVGTLAWGDEWFGGMTKNPWNTERGSSGSSAGSSSAVSAGLCGFALGSETLGSIVSPTRTCLTNGLRPSFGRVSRAGCMTLAWTMDKIGPIARSVEDCAIILSHLVGWDGIDPTVVEHDYELPIADWEVRKLRVGVPTNPRPNEQAVIDTLHDQGAQLIDVQFKPMLEQAAMLDALSVEAAAMHGKLFDTIQQDEEIGKWAPVFREAQFVLAVDYVRGMRARVQLIRETEAELAKVDVLVGDGDLGRMNLTGHPTLVVVFGHNEERNRPMTVALTGRMFGEPQLIHTGQWIQNQFPPLPSAPPLFSV